MVRGMKLLLSFVAFLLCFGVKISNADSGKSVGSKRKFISISNKAKDDAVIQCKSEKQSMNKTLKPGEKMRWGLVRETAPTTICEVDVGSKGVHGYLPAFVEKECKRECKWRVLDDGVLKLKGADGEWKRFELKADEEAARNYDEHHSCDDDDDDHYDVGKGKRGSGESRSLEPAVAPSPDEGKIKLKSPKSMPIPMSEKRKSRKRGARLAPSPNEGKTAMSKKKKSRAPATQIQKAPAPGKWVVENAKMKHRQGKSRPRNAQSAALPPTKSIKKVKKHGRRKLKPRHPRSPAPAKTHTPKSWKKKPRAAVAPPPMKHAQGIPTSSNYYSRSPIALAPSKSTQQAAPPMKQGRRKLKPRHPRAPINAISPTKEMVKTSENAPTPTTKWNAPAPAADPPENGKQTSTGGGEESEAEGPDAELSPLPRPGSTFYTCIKEDSR